MEMLAILSPAKTLDFDSPLTSPQRPVHSRQESPQELAYPTLSDNVDEELDQVRQTLQNIGHTPLFREDPETFQNIGHNPLVREDPEGEDMYGYKLLGALCVTQLLSYIIKEHMLFF